MLVPITIVIFISFIYLYALCFEKIHLIKPNSSNKKSGEFYLVGHKKKDIPDKMLEYYLKRMDDFKINQPLFYKKDISLLARNGFDFETSKKVMDIKKEDYVKIIRLL